MTQGVPAKVIAASLGLAGFSIALIAGLSADNPADQILVRALLSMIGCNAVGLLLGLIAEKSVQGALSAARERAAAQSTSPVTAHPAPSPIDSRVSTGSSRSQTRT
ncbi:MAG: hypothetical protein H7Y88_04830 [Phycisphaerales bacterium]|nr:hypothetical protein [Phycisphaerales bacterium]